MKSLVWKAAGITSLVWLQKTMLEWDNSINLLDKLFVSLNSEDTYC